VEELKDKLDRTEFII